MEELKEKITRAIGDCYDGFADPVATPSNWGRAVAATDEALRAIEEGGYALVPKATLHEIANRAANFMDPDAAEWMPSIYSIACNAVGEDATPLLKAWSKLNLEEPRG